MASIVGLDNLLDRIADQDEFFPPEGRAKTPAALQGRPNISCYVYANANHAFARFASIHWSARTATSVSERAPLGLIPR